MAQRLQAKAELAAMRKVRAEQFEEDRRRIKEEAARELLEVKARLSLSTTSLGGAAGGISAPATPAVATAEA